MIYRTLFNNQSLTLKFLIVVALLFNINHSNAGVNIKNGNFYVSYTDIDLGPTISSFSSIKRTYNSVLNYKGWFGYGWSSKMETKLNIYPDGYIALKEHGGGALVIFSSNFIDDELQEQMINTLIEIDIKKEKIKNNPSAIIKQKEKYTDFEQRTSAWDKYVAKGILKYKNDFPDGIIWEGTHYGAVQTLKKENNTYVRIKGKKVSDEFNNKGQLTKYIVDKFKYATLIYKNGFIHQIENADKTVIEFKTNLDGFISEVRFKKKKVTYQHENGNLILAEDSDRNQFGYEYDKVHNLTKVIYNPLKNKGKEEKSKKIKYHPSSNKTIEVIEKDGESTRYEYLVFYKDDGGIDKSRYGAEVTKTGFDGIDYTNYYEYQTRIKANGSRYTSKKIFKLNGVITETTYADVCSKSPIEIKRGRNITSFKYNNRCLLIEKIKSDGDVIKMKYHPTSEKLTEVLTGGDLFNYKYNDNLDLVYAQKNNDAPIELTYDDKGHITKMTTTEQILSFDYNSYGKPVKIMVDGQGSITIKYDETGRIENVKSDDDKQETSFIVTQAFQELMEVIKPSGVDLGM